MHDDAEAPDIAGCPEGSTSGEEQARRRIALSLLGPRDRKLSMQCRRNRIGLVALLRLHQGAALDVTRARRDAADDPVCGRVANDVGSGDMSTALRRTKSLRLVRARFEAASSRARSSSVTRTLSTELVLAQVSRRHAYDNGVRLDDRQRAEKIAPYRHSTSRQ
jgi:hypothetical protein